MSRVLILLYILLLPLLLPVSSRATTWYVNPQGTGDAPRIQAAIFMADEGDTITYTVTLTNEGYAVASDVEYQQSLPVGVSGLQVLSIPEGATNSSASVGGENGNGFVLVSGMDLEPGETRGHQPEYGGGRHQQPRAELCSSPGAGDHRGAVLCVVHDQRQPAVGERRC